MIADALLTIPDWLFNGVYYVDDLVAVVGSALIGAGIAGRRAGWGPHCGNCSFDLRAVPDGTPQCPECGASLRRGRSIRYGVRSPRWGMAAVGALMLAAGAISTFTGAPFQVIAWRENVIASVFTYDKLIDMALAGDGSAATELQQELRGSSRRRRDVGANRGAACLSAIMDRMEADTASRRVLLPLAAEPSAYMFQPGATSPVRLAKQLCEAAETDPTILDSIPSAQLSAIYQGSNSSAVMQLLSCPAMVARLFGPQPPAAQLSDVPVTLVLRAKFGGGPGSLWTHEIPLAVVLGSAAWRMEGEDDAAWRPISGFTQDSHATEARVNVTNYPKSGTIEVRASGWLAPSPPGFDSRGTGPMPMATSENAGPLAFEWKQTITLSSRDSLVLTPKRALHSERWLMNLLRGCGVVTAPTGVANEYMLLNGLRGDIQGAKVAVSGTLAQSGLTWPSTVSETRADGASGLLFRAEGFDPHNPFTVTLVPDLAAIRSMATSDANYWDVHALLHFAGLDRPPNKVEPPPTSGPD